MSNYITLYHGSDHVVYSPQFGIGKEDNDYGSGFYTTMDIDKAKAWAVVNGSDMAVCNKYQIDLEGLNVLNLDKHGPLAWISEVVGHRGARGETSKLMGDMIVDKYKIDTSKADIIVGYRADDSYIDIVDSFLKNELSVDEVERLFRKGNLGEQYFIKSEKAFGKLDFCGFEQVEDKFRYPEDEIIARHDVNRFLHQRQSAILINGFKPSGILARDAIKGNFVYNSESKFYFINNEISANKGMSIDEDMDFER